METQELSSAGLPPQPAGTTVEIMELFDELHNEGHTLIVVTHEDEIARHCHRVVEMKDGIIHADSGSAKITMTASN